MSNNIKNVRFSKDGKLKIMHISDTHLWQENIDFTSFLIGYACDREKPDIAVITGDIVANKGNKNVTKALIYRIIGVFQVRNIPVAVTFGNHDSERKEGFTRDELMQEYKKFPCVVYPDEVFDCATFYIPVLSSKDDNVKFNLWVIDSGDYDEEGHYASVPCDKINWYKSRSDELAAANNGERVNSFVFQHIIVPEIYDVLKKTDKHRLFSFPHMYNKDEYYMFDPAMKNYGTLNEKPCCGYYNYGQFSAMVEKGDVLGIFTGHDHTNAFGVEYNGIDIVNSLSSRYNGDRFETNYGYRMLFVDENNTSDYTTRTEHWYDMFSFDDIENLKKVGDKLGYAVAKRVKKQGIERKIFEKTIRTFTRLTTGRVVTYPEKN